jgi:hypothetical protein
MNPTQRAASKGNGIVTFVIAASVPAEVEHRFALRRG